MDYLNLVRRIGVEPITSEPKSALYPVEATGAINTF